MRLVQEPLRLTRSLSLSLSSNFSTTPLPPPPPPPGYCFRAPPANRPAQFRQLLFNASQRSISLTRCIRTSVEQQEAKQQAGGGGGEERINRPDLKRSIGSPGPKRIVTLACLLVIIYMYPMIFRPLFGIGSSSDFDEKRLDELKKAGLDPAKTRPSYMPEWTSPFGPKPSARGD